MFFQRKAYCFLVGFFFFIGPYVFSQDQKIADSLAKIYKADTAKGIDKLELLRNLAYNERNDLKLALRYAEELIRLSKLQGNNLYLYRGYFQKGDKKKLLGDLEEALAYFFKSVEAAKKENFTRGEGSSYMAIADIYSISKNYPNAMLYYNKAIATLRTSKDSIALASAILNAGDAYLNNKSYDSALLYSKEAGTIFQNVNYLIGKAYSLGNVGMVYANTGNDLLAEKNINEAIPVLEKFGEYYPICVYLISMCNIYLEKGDRQTALNYALRSLQLAQQYQLKDQISDAHVKLSELYEQSGNLKESLQHYKSYITYRDSVNNIKSVQKMADLRTNYEVSQKQIEVDLLNQQKRNQRTIMISLIIILALGAVILAILYWYYRAIAREKKRSENLLLNILPAETAKELKEKGKVEAVKFDQVTVLFTDFVEFSKSAEHIAPEQLVKSIDYYFKSFDEITMRYGLEKIKTIGDSYMCACGLPTANPTHARNVIQAAKEMRDVVMNELSAKDDLNHFNVRIGIHTGPVVAGIVGIKKWQYDIWGDTVNIASRMESKSEPGKINLSETTYQEIKDEFPCEYRGEIEVKNRGLLKMYFLS
ncbi:MAG TPA: adenylate/guanylate cyclase domain-containing protein [Flavisolibacter sp.]|jgi:class 3 adenylate cyclase|nr:adenylate/guanylate cyclase domain-containing protein [Flavisolibacter sp.]